jgi:tetratricopeptide (TPR) repeat protein
MRAETARRILGRAEVATGQLASQTGDDPEVRRSEAAMHAVFSNTYLRLGDSQLATDYARQATDQFRRFSAKQSGNISWREGLAVSLERLGDALKYQGDLSGALAAYREELDIRRSLAAGGPGVSIALNHIGDTLLAQGDLGGAVAGTGLGEPSGNA